ncbi:lipopolysaccharide heptosyltransferase II [Aquabacter spiritensis]|uniref:lipopolysaccharide heptosyltransferase II n=1 Tax=Aquabacter spiritensis TaxID=933073 RepID=A0A4V2UX90_9HYPH|nr:lipopolysaccharide heptosyltransferase II [Aquabacter spiritensis]TCT02608.1 heptosyltransferase-2 [Aquabacter spiritensis]
MTSAPILIAGFGGIGDHIRCFALARHIALQEPGAQIDFLCRSPVDRLVPFVPHLRGAFVDDTPHGRFGLPQKLRLAARLRRQGYRRAYIVSRTLKAALVPFLAGIPERVGWFGEGRAVLINRVCSGEARLYGETEKVCALAFSGRLAACGAMLPPEMVIPPPVLEAWRRAALGGMPAGPVLALGPGAYNDRRIWPPERFAEIARRFARRGWDIWLLGGPREQAVAAMIAGAAPIRDFTATPLDAAACQLASADLFLGNDSGLLHMAGALGVPSVGLFGPTVLEVTGPRNPGVVEVRPPDRGIDLRDVTIEAVDAALLARIAACRGLRPVSA